MSAAQESMWSNRGGTGEQRRQGTERGEAAEFVLGLAPIIADVLRKADLAADEQLKPKDLRTRCSCGRMSYVGGWCFGCGRYRPSRPGRAGGRLGFRSVDLSWPRLGL